MRCSPALCDNRADVFEAAAPASLTRPTQVMLALQGLSSAASEAAVAVWTDGMRFAEDGKCIYGRTDIANANRSESVVLLSTSFAAGACISQTACHRWTEHFVSACVSREKVDEALAISAHHSRHHPQVGGVVLLAVAALWIAGNRVLRPPPRYQHLALPMAILVLGGFLVTSAHSVAEPSVQPVYWNGCGSLYASVMRQPPS